MGFQYVVPDTEIIGWANLQAWCMLTGLISKANYALRLIDGEEILYSVLEMLCHYFCILVKPGWRIWIHPAAL